jgi:predicted secreted protein
VKKVKKKVGVKTGKFIAGLMIAILVSCAISAAVCPCARAASQWYKTYGGTGTDTGAGNIIQTSDGGYAISGDTQSFGAGGNDYWLIKTDADGNMLWNKTYGGAGLDSESDMCQTSDGGYALGGYTNSFGAGGTDFWLVKTDSSGTMQWNQTYGGTDGDAGWSIIQTIDGGYALAGNTASFGAGGTDFYVAKTDEVGVVPEGLTVGVMVLLSSVAVVVSTCYFRKRVK